MAMAMQIVMKELGACCADELNTFGRRERRGREGGGRGRKEGGG